jgi:hypothetical protein
MTVALVWAHMHTVPHRRGPRPRALTVVLGVLVVAVVAVLAACGSAAAPPSSEAPKSPPASVVPSHDPNGSIGIIDPAPSADPALIDPLGRVVVPKPGQLDVRAIPAQILSAVATGRHVTLTIDYTSGVEPCNILDSIVVAVGADAKTFAITVREGHGPQDVVCIEIAESKRAIVDLGDLAPGTYAISDTTGGAAPITVTVD